MVERIVLTIVFVAIGLAAYAGLLWLQRKRAAQGSKLRAGTGRSAVLVFTSPTCAACKLQQLPIVDRVLVEWRDTIEFDLVDVADRPEVATQYGVWSVPTTIVLDAQRQVVAINQGVVSEKKLREQLASTLRVESANSEWPNSHAQAPAN